MLHQNTRKKCEGIKTLWAINKLTGGVTSILRLNFDTGERKIWSPGDEGLPYGPIEHFTLWEEMPIASINASGGGMMGNQGVTDAYDIHSLMGGGIRQGGFNLSNTDTLTLNSSHFNSSRYHGGSQYDKSYRGQTFAKQSRMPGLP